MASHGSTQLNLPETPEQLVAERQRNWDTFTNATVGTVIFMVVLLVGMAVFLL
jgi:hypothetical protein